jgi:hypothetical protein
MGDLQKVHGLIGTILSFTIGFRTNSGIDTHTGHIATSTFIPIYLSISIHVSISKGVLPCLTLFSLSVCVCVSCVVCSLQPLL